MRSRLLVPAVVLVTAAYVKGRRDGRHEALPAFEVARPPAEPAPLTDQTRIAQALAADAVELAEAQAAAAGALYAEPEALTDDVLDPDDDHVAVQDLLILNEWVTAPAALRGTRPGESDALDLAISAEWATGLAPPAPRTEPVADEVPILVPDEALAAIAVEVEVRIDETGRFSLGGFATQAGHIALCGITFQERRSGLLTPDCITLVTEAANTVAEGGLVVLGDGGFAPDAEGFTIMLCAEGPGTFAAAGRYELAL